MTDRELMQESLLALRSCSGAPHWPALQPIVTALRERLARLDFEMQPCAGRNCGSTNPNLHSAECFEDYEKATGMRAWQGLTDEAEHQCPYPKANPSTRNAWLDGWEAAERAHGITGEQA